MRTMYDAITPANIPTDAQMVAGYVDGRYAWHAADWDLFPFAVKVRIAVFSSTNDGHVLDVEPGCSTPGSAPGWVQRRRAAGVDPTVYCNTATWPTVRAAFAAAGVREPHWWIAAYPGNGPNLYPGSVAHQYADPGPVDISVVADYWPGVDDTSTVSNVIVTGGNVAGVPPLHPLVPPTPTVQEDDMVTLIIWCYAQLVGRTGPPSVNEIENWISGTPSWSAAQVLEGFLGAKCEPGGVTKAFQDFLGHAPNASQITEWLSTAPTIREVRMGIAQSPEALHH
jgi:hypothetical protein